MNIVLQKKDLIGHGNKRLCYQHPNDPYKCIKIERNENDRKTQINILEFRYFEFIQNQNISLNHLPRMYGWCETNMGTGLVFDKICESDGAPSQSLHTFLESNGIDKTHAHLLLDELQDYLFFNAILIHDGNLKNVLVNELQSAKKLVFVDGVGPRRRKLKNFLYLRIRKLSRTKTLSKIRSMQKKIDSFQ